MAAPAAPANHLERIYGVNNIKNHIPVILDNKELNNDAWRELFLTHCQSFDVDGHLNGTLLPTNDNDQQWTKRDGLVKLWIYGTLSKDLFRIVFKTGGTAREIWTRIENYFRDNKEARAIRLDHELRTKTIGDQTIQDYCQDLKSISDLLANVDAPVSERTLVTYMVNGLSDKFANIINVIMHRQPFPTYDQARSMLVLEEERLNKGNKSPLVKVLNVTDSSQSSRPVQPQQQQRFFNNRGSNRKNRGRGRNNQQRPMYNQWGHSQAPQWSSPAQYSTPGILGPRPNSTPQALHLQTQAQLPGAANLVPTTDFASAFNTMTLMEPSDHQWYMDSGATAHLTNNSGNLRTTFNTGTNHTVTVANEGSIPITKTGCLSFHTPYKPLKLNSVLVTPSIIKNLVSVRKFTKDNSCSIEFDPFGFSVKDLRTQRTILRSNSTGDLYPVFSSKNKLTPGHSAFLSTSANTWHRRLAHSSNQTLSSLISSNNLLCNKHDLSSVCDACQIGKQIKLPFSNSDTTVTAPFEIIHSDVWTSPVLSLSGMKYYVLFLDQFTHFLWVFPIRSKEDVYSKFLLFSNYVETHFNSKIKNLQCDNGTEYNNSKFHTLFAQKGIDFRFSCPYTSQQNGRSERMIRTINNSVRTLLFQANLPSTFGLRHFIHLFISSTFFLPSP